MQHVEECSERAVWIIMGKGHRKIEGGNIELKI
jgi:hypothetical protein